MNLETPLGLLFSEMLTKLIEAFRNSDDDNAVEIIAQFKVKNRLIN